MSNMPTGQTIELFVMGIAICVSICMYINRHFKNLEDKMDASERASALQDKDISQVKDTLDYLHAKCSIIKEDVGYLKARSNGK